jgi:hypothetical protein
MKPRPSLPSKTSWRLPPFLLPLLPENFQQKTLKRLGIEHRLPQRKNQGFRELLRLPLNNPLLTLSILRFDLSVSTDV